MFSWKKHRLGWFSLFILCVLCAPARAELVAYWNFDTDGSAVSGPSFAPGYFDAVPCSANTVGYDGILFGQPGVFGGSSVYFPGTDRNNLAINKIDAMYNGSFTYSTWVKLERTDRNEMQLFGDWQAPHAFRFFYATSGRISTDMRRPNPPGGNVVGFSAEVPGAPGAWDTNEWYHLAMVYDAKSGRYSQYINGVLAGTASPAPEPRMDNSADTRKQHFGWKQDDSNAFQGWMDETYIFDNPLYPIQVRALYQYNSLELAASDRYTRASIPLGQLFNTQNTKMFTLKEAVAAGTNGANANVNNLGVAAMRAGSTTLTYAGTLDLTGTGSQFNLENLGMTQTGYGAGVRNGNANGTDINFGGYNWGVGMHANSVITFDLDELRIAGGLAADTAFQFLATAGNIAGGTVNMAVIVWDANNNPIAGYVNGMQERTFDPNGGVWKFDAKGVTNGAGQERVIADNGWLTNAAATHQVLDIALSGDARYLTLISADADGSMNSDHGAFAGARLSIVHNGFWLNQLFGTGTQAFQDARWGLNYAHSQNINQIASVNDLGVKSLWQKGGDSRMSVPFSLTDADDTKGILFNAGILAGNSSGWGSMRSNVCVETNNHGGLPTTGIILRDGYEAAIGLHANATVTFDLNELRELGGWDTGTWHFSSTFASPHTGTGTITGLVLVSGDDKVLQAFYQGVDVSDLLDKLTDAGTGLDYWTLMNMAAMQTAIGTNTDMTGKYFDFELDAKAEYLSLLALNGGNGNTAHAAYYDPLLTFSPNDGGDGVPEPATWGMLILGILGLGYFRKGKTR